MNRSKFLPVMLPCIDDSDVAAVSRTLRSGWLTVGPRCLEFEKALRPWTGARYVHAVSSCTAALELALRAFGIGKGDLVITSPITFTATAAAIHHAGARPLLADVEPDTGNIDPAEVDRLTNKYRRVKAILPVHFAGHPCEMDALMKIARRRRLLVIEDAAHALSAAYKGKPIGSIGHAACYSFYACKNLCGIEGGAIATNLARIDRKVRCLSLHGISRDAWKRYGKEGSWKYDVVEPGFKANFTDVQAALALSQLKKLRRMQARRTEIADRYTGAFSSEEFLQTPVTRGGVRHAWHVYVLRIVPAALRIDRDRFVEALRARNIGTSVHFIPIHLYSFYRKILKKPAKAYPRAMDFYSRALTIPLYPSLSDRDVDDVIDAVRDVGRRFRR